MAAVSFEEVSVLLKEAKNPLIATGAKSSAHVIDQAIRLSDTLDAHVAATGNSIADFRGRNFSRCSKEWIAELTNFMLWPEWKGYDGKGKPDLIIFVGYLASTLDQFLSTLKCFASCKTLTLDNKYLSNATYSLSPSSTKEWEAGIKGLTANL